GLQHGQAPRLDAGLDIDVEADERGVAARVRKERERAVADRALHDGRLRGAAEMQPRDVADARPRGVPGHEETIARGGRARRPVTRDAAAAAGTARSPPRARTPAAGRSPRRAWPPPRRRATRACGCSWRSCRSARRSR